ncbi:MAG TPA: lamin tail domain-containing protein, partial [Pyrinomonadaceae bacterium]|nr:lamin tail domain-containing protein [Pyrinomonadaceae bacterium]
ANSAARRPSAAVVAAPNTKQTWTAAPRRGAPSAPLPLAPATEGQLVISEFRYNGTAGPLDEFIEIYNNSGADLTVQTSDLSAGYAVVASDGITRFTIPNGTVIPARGHYLGCNSSVNGYSVASYPAGNGTTATCDATYIADIPLDTGIALFNTANPVNFTLVNRLDAVGSTAEANALYKEGVGVRNLNASSVAYSYSRRRAGGCIGTNPGTADSNCTSTAAIAATAPPASLDPQDTDDNRADFIFVDTNGTQTSSEASQQRLGAPGPENLSSPIVRTSAAGAGVVKASLVDACAGNSLSPNRVRDLTNDPAEPTDTFGSLFIRRKFTNNTGANVTRLRFRIIDITTFPSAVFSVPAPPNDFCGAPGSQCAADLRALTSTAVVVSVSAPCGGGTATVQGTTLEQGASPGHQPNGGGFNSTLSAGVITLATPLRATDDPGTPAVKENEVNLQFRFGVQQTGTFRVFMVIEVLP